MSWVVIALMPVFLTCWLVLSPLLAALLIMELRHQP